MSQQTTPIEVIDYKLDATQTLAWQQTKSGLLWRAPGFTHVLLTMLNPKEDDGILYWTRSHETMATDGEVIYANPEFFFSLKLQERIYVVCHEVCHAIWMHCIAMGRCVKNDYVMVGKNKLKVDLPKINQAMDYIINDLLIVSKIGTKPDIGLHDTFIGKHDDAWPIVYKRLVDQAATGKGQAPDPKQTGFDTHLAPGASQGKTQEKAEETRNSMQWQNAVRAAANITAKAKGMGNSSGDPLTKFFDKMLEPHVPWQDHIFGELARRIGSGGYDYKRPDRRLIVRDIFAPSRSGKGVGTVGVFLDSSGSIYSVPKLIDRFFSEVGGVLGSLNPRLIVVIWCDSRVRRVDIIQDEQDLSDCYYKGASGGGGTSFVPPFKKLQELIEQDEIDVPDAVLYLTDGDGTFPSKREFDYPVIWGDISGDIKKYPFGEVVRIPNDGNA